MISVETGQCPDSTHKKNLVALNGKVFFVDTPD